MSLALLFTAHNRLEFVRESFAALVRNTSWDLVDRLVVLDDASTDGTQGHLASEVAEFYEQTGRVCEFETAVFGGPVAAMNHALDRYPCDVLAKVDSDVVVCPGWLEAMLEVLANAPEVDALGMEPGFGDRVVDAAEVRSHRPAGWIGGVGLIRTRVFAHHRPQAHDTFHGWTTFQREHVNAAWVTPDLPVFLLDHLPFEPWRSLAAEYVAAGWSRAWPVYPADWSAYWSWWAGDREAVA